MEYEWSKLLDVGDLVVAEEELLEIGILLKGLEVPHYAVVIEF